MIFFFAINCGDITYAMYCLQRTGFSQASNTAKKTRSELQIAKDFRAFMSTFLEVYYLSMRQLLGSVIKLTYRRFFLSLTILVSTLLANPTLDSTYHGKTSCCYEDMI